MSIDSGSFASQSQPHLNVALARGYPERFAQQALAHNSKGVHHACSKHAEVTAPSLDDWEKQWKKNPQRMEKSKVVGVDFQGQQERSNAQSSAEVSQPLAPVKRG
jgi:hypothetical protein